MEHCGTISLEQSCIFALEVWTTSARTAPLLILCATRSVLLSLQATSSSMVTGDLAATIRHEDSIYSLRRRLACSIRLEDFVRCHAESVRCQEILSPKFNGDTSEVFLSRTEISGVSCGCPFHVRARPLIREMMTLGWPSGPRLIVDAIYHKDHRTTITTFVDRDIPCETC